MPTAETIERFVRLSAWKLIMASSRSLLTYGVYWPSAARRAASFSRRAAVRSVSSRANDRYVS